MAAATNQDFTIYEGEDKELDFYVLTDSSGTPVNVGVPTSATWVMKDNAKASATAHISKTYAGGGITIHAGDDTTDLVRVTLDAADTQGYEGKTYYHECRVEDGSGDSHVIATGDITVAHSATA